MQRILLSALALCAAGAAYAQAPADLLITRNGAQASIRGAAANFTGAVRVDPLYGPRAPSRGSASYVTFEPGARSAWHSHPLARP